MIEQIHQIHSLMGGGGGDHPVNKRTKKNDCQQLWQPLWIWTPEQGSPPAAVSVNLVHKRDIKHAVPFL